jgi:hypothetical protein
LLWLLARRKKTLLRPLRLRLLKLLLLLRPLRLTLLLRPLRLLLTLLLRLLRLPLRLLRLLLTPLRLLLLRLLRSNQLFLKNRPAGRFFYVCTLRRSPQPLPSVTPTSLPRTREPHFVSSPWVPVLATSL